MSEPIVNKVAQSVLITLNLEEYFPKEEVMNLDLKDYLYMEVMLKEKEFRDSLKDTEWINFDGKIVALHCSVDAIIPLWAYMLTTSYLQPVAADVLYGEEAAVTERLLLNNLKQIQAKDYEGKRVVIKGCGDKKIPASAYTEITKLLTPYVKSLMYGEPCSTVPVFKRK